MTPSSASPSGMLGNIAEICIVTPDIYRTIDGLTMLGIGPFQIFEFNSATVPRQQHYGRRGTDLFRIKAAFAKQNSLVVELMQPLAGGSEKSLMQKFLDDNGGREGVQHIAWDMGGIPMAERLAKMRERGFEPAMQGWWQGRKGQCHFCFFDTLEKGAGTVFETIDFSEDWEDPECEWYPRQSVPEDKMK
ncbi:hypothetical protein PV08_11382 [Exophiala spinifera]|uniref:VOC domain-containing protein n=1 Tax=Exophiala spinifera TaxID=91928 RepID=A0A0D2BGD9_9EURO|nr:uncharacterized protein PV08_11382 [Exophiala spinifera]KIW10419.1 hypothetical protein PV08_11382 [Exophiala spinifera]